jgi:hypothetical protein
MMFIATISKGTRNAILRKKFQAIANPSAPSTHSLPKRIKGDGTGRYVTISAKHSLTAHITIPQRIKAIKRPAGPPFGKAEPI